MTDEEVLDDTLEPELETDEEEDADEGHEEGHGDGEGQDARLHEEGDEKEEVRPKGRASNDFGRLRAENRALKESQETIRRELDEVRAENQRRAQQPDPAQERLRYEAMSDYEKLEYRLNQTNQENQNRQRALEARLWAQADKSEFNTLCTTNDKASKRAERVEREFERLTAKGQPVDRATIVRWMIGDDVLKSKAVAKRAAEGKRNIARQRTSPTNARGDVGGGRQKGGTTAAERLFNGGDLVVF
jgi:hypothetical protein